MHLIVGVDPGTTSAVAALDLRGRLVGLYSSKDMGLDRIVEYIVSLGTVSLLSTDVSPAPAFVLRITAKLGCPLYVPKEPVAVSDKLSLTRHYRTGDAHQRDALSAALIAYSAYRNKLRKIESFGLSRSDEDAVKHLVLRGVPVSEARQRVAAGKDAPEAKPFEKAAEERFVRELSAEEKRMKSLDRQCRLLREQLSEKDAEAMELKRRMNRLTRGYDAAAKKEDAVRKRDLSIRNLRYTVSDLEKRVAVLSGFKDIAEGMLDGRLVGVGVYPRQKRGFVLVRMRLCKPDARELSDAALIFTDENRNRELLGLSGVPCAGTKWLSEIDGFHYLKAKDIDSAYEEAGRLRGVSLESIVDSYRKERK